MKATKPNVIKTKNKAPKFYVLFGLGTLDDIVKIFPFKPETLGIKHLSK